MELKDRVEQISAMIAELRQPNLDGRSTRELIDSIFRSVHSLKAAATTEGLNDLSRIAHQFEDLLHALRTGKVTLDTELLQAFDETVAEIRNGSQTSSLDYFSRVTRQTLESHELPIEFASLKDEEQHRAIAAMREGSHLYVMEAVFEVKDFDERFRQLRGQLQKTAELISTSARMEDDKIIFQVAYASKSEQIRVHTLLEQALQAGKSVAANLDKQVNFVVRGDEILLDRSVGDALADALLHLVRNAVDHGIESRGTITFDTAVEQGQARVTITDDGRGIDSATLQQLFQPGFSTVTEVTEFSGRGVGLDAVQAIIKQLGGSVSVTSEPGKGSSFQIMIPNPSSDA